jgi:hypothetical protein
MIDDDDDDDDDDDGDENDLVHGSLAEDEEEWGAQ